MSHPTLRKTSTVKEPPSIVDLMTAYSERSTEHSISDLAMPPLMAFALAEHGLVVKFSDPQSIKILACFGFSSRIQKRLADWHKAGARPGLMRWLSSLYDRLKEAPCILDSEPSSTSPDELPPVRSLFASLLASNTALILLNPEGLHPLTLPLLDPFFSVVQQLLREEQLHRTTLHSLVQLSQAIDRQGEAILYVSARSLSVKQASPSADKFLGETESVLDKKVWRIFDKEKASLKELFASIANSQPESPSTVEELEAKCWRLRDKDQEVLVSFPGKATIKHSTCIILLLRKADSYEKRIRDVEEKSKTKTEFMAHLGHEIRTPLNCILSIMPLLSASQLNEEQKRYVQIISQSSFDIMMNVGDFLDMAKLDSKRMQLHESEIALDELIDLVHRSMKPSAEAKHIELSRHIDSSVPAKIFVDFSRLRQVIQNLVGNAIKFTRKGSVHLAISAKHHVDYHRIEIRVQDTGIGIAEENLKLIFKSFRQVDESSTQEFGGIGLGLAISKKLMKLMDHGCVQVESQLGIGSTFTIEFNSPILDNELLLKKHNVLLTGKRVLIVDDTANNRISLFSQLEQWGLQPTTSPSAEDAINSNLNSRGQQDNEPFDLGILDLRMPRMDGVGLANWIRRRGLTFPLILLSSSPEESDRLTAEEKALFKFSLVRPVPQRRLLATVISALGSEDRTLNLIINEAPAVANASGARAGSVAVAAEKMRMSRPPAELKGTRILVAEDTALNQRVIDSLLRRIGYSSIEFVGNGQAVLDACEKPNAHYDVILMDMKMPVMNGFVASKMLSNIYSQRRLSRPKIIAITAMGISSEVLDWCTKGYLDDAIGKPLDMVLLKEKLDRILGDLDQKRRLSTPM